MPMTRCSMRWRRVWASCKAVARLSHVSHQLSEPDADFDKLLEEMQHLQTQLEAQNGWSCRRASRPRSRVWIWIRTSASVTVRRPAQARALAQALWPSRMC